MLSLSSFPNEIKDIVVSMLAQDASARKDIVLVSAHFRKLVYRLIFRDFVLDGKCIAGFHDLMSSSFSAAAILPRIYNFALEVSPTWADQEWHALSSLLPLLALNSQIHSFSINCASSGVFGECPSRQTQPQLTAFPSVRVLKLQGLSFSQADDLEVLLFRFPNVTRIELRSVMCRWKTGDLSRVQLPGKFSAQFDVEDPQQHRKIVHWQLSEPVSSLKPDQIAALANIANSTVSSSLQSLGLSLHHLSVRFHLYDFQTFSPDDMLQTFDLSATPQLRKLSLGSSSHVLSLMPWVPAILYTLSKSDSSTLTTLEIVYASSRQIHLDRAFLRYLSFALSEPPFKALQTIHFVGYQDNPTDLSLQKLVKDLIKSVLWRWDEKSMLEFSFRKTICVCCM
ncbi:hypothetical protein CVT24_007081 [Panaeolus cyanescens]|uniref:F-box domain-containing protein n=1 Tax=Panaeolus cyanescens TaxID=181874 RepID=A0A409YP31_9AGAR|nr:hypothetical protein CVT24_007081 [Panaeolus cyanescens]